jgi:predicted transcriptional regulator
MIRDMKDRGMSNREIARDLGISRNTVSKLLRTTRLTDHRKRKRGSKLDPYREKIRALIDEHNLSAVRILEEIRGQEKRSVAPDITYYESDYKVAVEVKIVVVKESEGAPRLFKHDLDRIDSDYKKMLDKQSYEQFDRKYLVVVFLGIYDKGFTQEEFKETISKRYPGTNDISVIVF